MGGASSRQITEVRRKAAAEEEAKYQALLEAKLQEETELRNRVLLEAYNAGREEAMFEAIRVSESVRTEDLGIGVTACLISAFCTALVFKRRAGMGEHASKEKADQVAAAHAKQLQELAAERERVTEIETSIDANRALLANQEKLIKKQQTQFAQARAKYQLSRLNLLKMRRRNQSLRVDLTTLREQNGALYQRFIASTSGAIIMACVAAGFAIASHGSHDAPHSDAHATAPSPAHVPETSSVIAHAPSSTAEQVADASKS